MVAWLDKLTNLSSSIRAEVSSPESSKKETTQLGFVGMGSRTRTQRSSWITLVLYRTRVFCEGVDAGMVLCARSIEPFEGGRWRLRQTRASGCTDLTAMGIESFFVCSQLILLGLGKLEKTENRS